MNSQVTWCVAGWCVALVGAGCGGAATGGANVDSGNMAEVADTVTAGDSAGLGDVGEVTGTPGANYFTHAMPWDRAVAGEAKASVSDAIIGYLDDMGGWGNGGVFQIDFSLTVLEADAGVVARAFEPNDDWFEGECDADPLPVPPGGALEGEEAYACEGDGDCHLIVRQGETLYEMWRADLRGASFSGGCLAVWHLDKVYDANLRGRDCSSADAAGLPIAPLTFTADDVASGHIDHAIRFILPNDRIRHRTYVAPGTHATGAADGGATAPPYGIRLRLRADFPLASLPSEGARVVARALQTYGMFLADGGQIALTAQSDRWSANHWEDLLEPRDLELLQVTDFEVVDFGTPVAWEGNCELSGP